MSSTVKLGKKNAQNRESVTAYACACGLCGCSCGAAHEATTTIKYNRGFGSIEESMWLSGGGSAPR